MRLAAFEPDIPQNLGALVRLCACLAVPLDVIGPCGFPFSTADPMADRHLKRVALDYAPLAEITGYASWRAYADAPRTPDSRLLLLTTSGDTAYTDFAFGADDTLLVGRETSGVPETVHGAAAARLVVPMDPEARSLNVVVAAAMVLGEALRQTAAGSRPNGEGGKQLELREAGP